MFVYKEDGELKINLIYDSRQKATDILRKMGFNLEDNKASYDSLKRKYDILEAEYFKEKSLLESRVLIYRIVRINISKMYFIGMHVVEQVKPNTIDWKKKKI